MKILLLEGRRDIPSAITICMDNLANEFKSRGDEVWTISYSKSRQKYLGNKNGIQFYNVRHNMYESMLEFRSSHTGIFADILFKIVSLIRHFILLPVFPNVAPFCSRRVYRLAKRIIVQNEIDVVVCPYHPFENIYTALKLKKDFGGKLRVVTYHLDIRTVTGNKNEVVRSFVKRRTYASLIEENKIVDKILVPYTGKGEMESILGLSQNKIKYLGFPVFVPLMDKDEKCPTPFENDKINIAYIGTLATENRPPQYILKLLEKVKEKSGLNIVAHFWGVFEGTGLAEVLNNSPVAKYQGLLDKKYVSYMMSQSDFVLNIGNKTTPNMLPSKVFSVFALGKPIINVINNPEDASIPYLEMYGNIVDIRAYENNFDRDIDILINKLVNPQSVGYNTVKEKFRGFAPSFVCDEIIKD